MRATIGVIGDWDLDRPSHQSTNLAIEYAAAGNVDIQWLSTCELSETDDRVLNQYDGFICAPGSPYASMDGALRAVRFAREQNSPLLGTCGGFHHVVIEFARHVLGYTNLMHPEYAQTSLGVFITPVCDPLAGKAVDVLIDPSSRVFAFYGAGRARETYRCSFELNRERQSELEAGGLHIAGWDEAGRARIVELRSHVFFIATLFLPQANAAPGKSHPLFQAFFQAAMRRREKPDFSHV